MFHKVMKILEQYHYRLPALRFILDLFDKRVMRQIVLDDDSDEDGESGSDTGQDESSTAQSED